MKTNLKNNEIKTKTLYSELENVRNEKKKIEIENEKHIFNLGTKLKEEQLNNRIFKDKTKEMHGSKNKK